MTTNITTAEQAINNGPERRTNSKGFTWTREDMRTEVGLIRVNDGARKNYLSHPEIIAGLSVMRFSPRGLIRRLDEMVEADSNNQYDCK